MKIRLKKEYLIGVTIAALVIVFDILQFWRMRWFFTLIVLAINISWSQFWMDFFKEQKRQKEIEEKFLELVRALVGTVKSGIPIPLALRQTADKDYGALTKYTKKLAYQLEWGMPVHDALLTFSKDTGNMVIKRSVSIVLEAEKSGGDIENVLESVTDSVIHVKKMKAERRAETYSQMVQGYLVFFIFIGIMLLLQLKLFPLLQGMSGTMTSGLGNMDVLGGVFSQGETANMDMIFFSLLMIQGFFAGIMIGKFSEGTLKQGLIHSLILMTLAALIITTGLCMGCLKGGV